jgi:hypothetical protein
VRASAFTSVSSAWPPCSSSSPGRRERMTSGSSRRPTPPPSRARSRCGSVSERTSRTASHHVRSFVIADYPHGTELWRTDGTAAGTWRVTRGSFMLDLVNVDGSLFFFQQENLLPRFRAATPAATTTPTAPSRLRRCGLDVRSPGPAASCPGAAHRESSPATSAASTAAPG